MTNMPLLIAAAQAMLGSMVPVMGRSKRVKVQGLAPGDQVIVIAHGEDSSWILFETENDHVHEVMDPEKISYLQAEKIGERSLAVYVWVEF